MLMGCRQAWMSCRTHEPAMATRAHELRHMLKLLKGGAFVVHEDSIAKQLFVSALLQVQGIAIKLVASACGETGWETLDDFLTMPDAPGIKVEDQDMDTTAFVLFSSGTASVPKCWLHSNRTIAAICDSVALISELDEDWMLCSVMPMFHLGGLIESLPIWTAGGIVVYLVSNLMLSRHSRLLSKKKAQTYYWYPLCVTPCWISRHYPLERPHHLLFSNSGVA